MRFYDREKEIKKLQENWERSAVKSVFTVNEIDRTALVAEVKRNPDHYNAQTLKTKYETIQSEFGKYKDVKLVGLSLKDM